MHETLYNFVQTNTLSLAPLNQKAIVEEIRLQQRRNPEISDRLESLLEILLPNFKTNVKLEQLTAQLGKVTVRFFDGQG